MLKRLKLGTKIGLGFGFILLLLVLGAVSGYAGLTTVGHGLKSYQEIARDISLAGHLNASMLSVRMTIKEYLISPNDITLKSVNVNIQKTRAILDQAKQVMTSDERTQLIRKSFQSLAQYEASFAKVTQLISDMRYLKETQLLPNGKKMSAAMSALMKSSYEEDDTVVLFFTAKVQENLLGSRLLTAQYLNSSRESDYNSALKLMTDLEAKAEDLEMQLSSKERVELLRTYLASHKGFTQALKNVHKIVISRETLLREKLIIIEQRIEIYARNLYQSVQKEQDLLGPELYDVQYSSVMKLLLITIAALIIGITFSFHMTRSITDPLKRAVDVAHRLAKGDLSIDFQIEGHDETAQLLQALHETAESLKQMVGSINEAATDMTDHATQLNKLTDQTYQGSKSQLVETDQVAVAINEMTVSVQEVAINTLQAASAAKDANQQSCEGAEVVENSIVVINELAQAVDATSAKLHELEKETFDIDSICDVIRGIADQTNLLALNAAIEAARAGEQGRGFAVVADEVRSLAQRTQTSIEEIQTLIERLQAKAKSAVSVMTVGRKWVDTSVLRATETSNVLQTITASVSLINEMNAQIANAVEQQNTVSEDINQRITKVNDYSQHNVDMIAKTSASSCDIDKLASQLQQMISRFKLS